MKYDVMSGANIYRTEMESTLSEHHQQNAKNFDVTFEIRNGVNFDVISCIYFQRTPLHVIEAVVSLDMNIGVPWSCYS
jgi:hypothetical protein